MTTHRSPEPLPFGPALRWLRRIEAGLAWAALGLSMHVGVARAQQASDESAEAKRIFERAEELEKEELLEQALREYRRAYEKASRYEVLNNIGDLEVTLGRYVEGIDTLRQYLREGAGRISEDRRAQVQRRIDYAQSQVARLPISTERPGALVIVDGQERGRTPLDAPLRLDPGSHEIAVGHDGADAVHRTFILGAGDAPTWTPDLPPAPPAPPRVGTLRFDCPELQGSLRVGGRAVPRAEGVSGLTLDPGLYPVALLDPDGTVRGEQSYEIRANETTVVLCPRSPPPPPAESATRQPKWTRIVGYGLIGASAGFGIAATVAAVQNHHRYGDWLEKKRAYDDTFDPAEREDLAAEAATLGDAIDAGENTVAGLAVTAGALGVAGAVLVVLDGKRRESPRSGQRVRPHVAVGEQGVGFVTWSGRW